MITLAACQARAQETESFASRMAPRTRAGEIEMEREEKAASLAPDQPTRLEQTLDKIEDNKIPQRVFGGLNGLRLRMGGLITYSGFAAGPEYVRHDLLHGQIHFHTSIRGSTREFYLMDAGLNLPTLANNHAFLDFYGVHFSYPHVDFYGEGPHSHESGRTGYLLENTHFDTTAGLRPFEHLSVGVTASFLMVHVGPGRDPRFALTTEVFNDVTAPGLARQPNFAENGAFIQYDWRDNPGGPRHGGNYFARWTQYNDLASGFYSFHRLHLEAQQYFSFFNQRRVIALRGRIVATDPMNNGVVPFYLQPALGGPDDLRGFRPLRFYDNNATVLNAEYRWEVFSGLDMALFVDGGQVFDRWQHVNYHHLDKDAGFGFRFNIRNDVFLRIDTGFSREGAFVWFKFNNIF